MGRTNNLNQQGQVRLELIGGPGIQFREGTNSGLFTGVAYTGVGVYTVSHQGISPRTQIRGQVEGAVPGFVACTRTDVNTTVVRVFTSAAGNAALDASVSLKATEQFLG